MNNKLVQFIFFGNYFVGILAIALSIECNLQLGLPLNSFSYYCLLFTLPIVYYTYAYRNTDIGNTPNNPRAQWYSNHKVMIKRSQLLLSSISLSLILYFLIRYFNEILELPFVYWAGLMGVIAAAILYYGLLPKFGFNLNLRNSGWIKAFIIGFVWACCTNLIPLIALRIEHNITFHNPYLWTRLFVKNLMFCTVNAIMFDIKDYPTDANLHLRTFVVRFGLRRTINFILVPLTLLGTLMLCLFAYLQHFAPLQFAFNLLPFLLTFYLAFSLQKRKKLWFYLVVIDGLILFKAICGILGVCFTYPLT